jgi:hypothetical protein
LIEITPDPGPLLAAAIVAAITRLDDEAAAAAAVPPGRPVKGKWVAAGLPREVLPPVLHRPLPAEHSHRPDPGDALSG